MDVGYEVDHVDQAAIRSSQMRQLATNSDHLRLVAAAVDVIRTSKLENQSGHVEASYNTHSTKNHPTIGSYIDRQRLSPNFVENFFNGQDSGLVSARFKPVDRTDLSLLPSSVFNIFKPDNFFDGFAREIAYNNTSFVPSFNQGVQLLFKRTLEVHPNNSQVV